MVKMTVAMTPQLLGDPRRHAVAVVDVLRATTSLVAMFDGGLLRALISDEIAEARALARRNFSLLCGEVAARPPAGFDYGNSPAEFAGLSFRGKSVVLFTTNGTRALRSARGAPVALGAALVNRRAAALRLVSEAAKRQLDVAILCAGVGGGTAFSLEDTAAAGAMVEVARDADPAIVMTDEAWAALHLWRFYRGDAMRMFRQSAHGRALLGLGFEADLRFAARVDASTAVPVLFGEELRLRARRR